MPRSIPDDHLFLPVLAEGGSIGSGFYYLDKGKATYFVTAKHVLYDQQTGNLHAPVITLTSRLTDPSQSQPLVMTVDLGQVAQDQNVRGHPTADVAAIRVATHGQQGKTPVPGVSLSIKVPGMYSINVIREFAKPFDEVFVANDVYVFGYPRSLGLQHIPQLDYSMPLLRKGIVAGKNEQLKTLIIDAPVYPGNSGGPVVELEPVAGGVKYRVIGVVIQFVPAVTQVFSNPPGIAAAIPLNSGYAVVEPMDKVLELIAGF